MFTGDLDGPLPNVREDIAHRGQALVPYEAKAERFLGIESGHTHSPEWLAEHFGPKSKGWRESQRSAAGRLPYSWRQTKIRSVNIRSRGGNLGRRRVKQRGGYTRVGGYYGRYNRGFQSESKFFDFSHNNAVMVTGGEILNSINLIAQGATEKTRIGRKIVLSSIHLNAWVRNVASPVLTDGFALGRFILYVDHQCNGATATVTDILASANYQSFRNLEQASRFTILFDKTIVVNAGAAQGDGTTFSSYSSGKAWKYNKKCNLPILFDGATGVMTEVCCNNIGLLEILGSDGAAMESNIRFRLRFKG